MVTLLLCTTHVRISNSPERFMYTDVVYVLHRLGSTPPHPSCPVYMLRLYSETYCNDVFASQGFLPAHLPVFVLLFCLNLTFYLIYLDNPAPRHDQYVLHRCGAHTGWRRLIGCLIVISHFPQKSPTCSGSFAKNDKQLKASCGSLPPCTHLLPCVLYVCVVLTVTFARASSRSLSFKCTGL